MLERPRIALAGTLLGLMACASAGRRGDAVPVKDGVCVRIDRQAPTRNYPQFDGTRADEAALRELLKGECIVGITAVSDEDFGRECPAGSQDEYCAVLPIFKGGRPQKEAAVVEIHSRFDHKTGTGEGALVLVEKVAGRWRIRERTSIRIATIS